MNVIIDTHIFLWALAEPEKIEHHRKIEIETSANTVFVSAITVAELMIKTSLGKLNIDFDPVKMAKQSGFELLEFSAADALLLGEMPYHHKDPFDRMLIAQAISRNYAMMSSDKVFERYDCKLI